jgi:hypothetical protein
VAFNVADGEAHSVGNLLVRHVVEAVRERSRASCAAASTRHV